MECEFIAPHIKEDLKTSRGLSTLQPRCNQRSTRKTPSRRSSKNSKTPSEVLGGLRYSATKSSGAC
ncbi:hypothetical protein C2845_PM05G37560 [Panicum miliaceum]|uniref:Uncharacterized protein n=1 Tax=Panicum miliaceum TaxID=4540 RepID=A0A3L6SY84_PANMI|nr:hypothetical protein C2845_PM05G37560 [Panicum miliaceum]